MLEVPQGTDHMASLKMYKARLKDWGVRKNIKADEAFKVAAGHTKALGFWPESRSTNYDHRIARHLRTCRHNKDARERLCRRCRTLNWTAVVLNSTTPAYPSKALGYVEMGLYYSEAYFQGVTTSQPQTARWFYKSFALETDKFTTLFSRGIENLAHSLDTPQAFADINRSFDHLKGIFEANHPSVFHNLVRKLAACKMYPESDICLKVCQILAKYCQQLSLVIYGESHPLTPILAADVGLVEYGDAGHFELFLQGTRILTGKYCGAAPGCLHIDAYVPSEKREMTAEALYRSIGLLSSTTTEVDTEAEECRLALAELSLKNDEVDKALELTQATLASYDSGRSPSVHTLGHRLWASEILWRGEQHDQSIRILKEIADSFYKTDTTPYQTVSPSSSNLDQRMILGLLRYRFELLGRKLDYQNVAAELDRLADSNREPKPLRILHLTGGDLEI